jgi:hypothetical protein
MLMRDEPFYNRDRQVLVTGCSAETDGVMAPQSHRAGPAGRRQVPVFLEVSR